MRVLIWISHLFCFGLLVTPAVAAGAADANAAPALRAGVGADARPVPLSSADVRTVINGYLAETTFILTFRNDAGQVLEGELLFPLPEGATVSGFGLDVDGVIVDGVPVEKQKARVSYETEVRKSVDPGLVEHVAGNNFRTRVYPIPANGTRTVKLQYVFDAADAGDGAAGFAVPLRWDAAVPEVSVRVEVIGAGAAAEVRGGLEGLAFERRGDRLVAECSGRDARLSDLTIELKEQPARHVAVEKRRKAVWTVEELEERQQADVRFDEVEPEYYFVIHDTPPAPPRAAERAAVHRIGLLWDASLSRAEADKGRELKLVEAILGRLGDAAAVDVVVFRDKPEPFVSFGLANGGVARVIEHLAAVTYDGGTDLGALKLLKNATGLEPRAWREQPADYGFLLVFGDGNGTVGDGRPPKAAAPVFAFSNDPRANHAVLRKLAQDSGGAYFNLQRVRDAEVLRDVGRAPFAFLGVESDAGRIADVQPAGVRPIHGRFAVTGKLLAPEATLTLKYGYGGKVTHRHAVTLRRADAIDTGLVPRFWAQHKVAELSGDPQRNDEALLKLGREFSIVTPNTSLLVLETADQYVQHRIVPPKTRPQVYKDFVALIENRQADRQASHEDRVQHVLAMWQERVAWWGQKFEYPANFAYSEPPQAEDAGGVPATSRPAGRRDLEALVRSVDRPLADRSTGSGESEGRPAETPAPEPAPAPANTTESSAGRGETTRGRGFVSRQPQDQFDGVLLPTDAVSGGEYDDPDVPGGATILVKAWDPDTPYLKAMKDAGADKAYAVYLEQRKEFGKSPAFYLDCADYLMQHARKDLGVRVLTSVAELHLEDARLLRIVAHRLNQVGERDLAVALFERVLRLRPEEPQSYRDLALVLAGRADMSLGPKPQTDAPDYLTAAAALIDYVRAVGLLYEVVIGEWERFDGVQVVALMEANRIAAAAQRLVRRRDGFSNPIDRRLAKNLDLDVRVVLTWDTDHTDIDLWVTEPSGEKCFYSHNRTTIGGLVSKDFTDGYGPEEYCLRRLMPGAYKVQAHFYGSGATQIVGPTTVQMTIVTNFGRPDEKRESRTLRLDKPESVVEVGTFTR